MSFQEGVLERVKAHELRVEQWTQQLGGRVRRVEEEGDRVSQMVAERCAMVERRAAEEVTKVREQAKRRDKRLEGEIEEVRREVHRVKVEACDRCERMDRERD